MAPPATLISCPLEIKIKIFKELQAITSGPRYRIYPKDLDAEASGERDCDWDRQPRRFKVQPKDLDTGTTKGRRTYKGEVWQWSSGYDYRLCWELVDPGALYLASTCRDMFHVYKSIHIAQNLIIELPETTNQISNLPVWSFESYHDKYSLRSKTGARGDSINGLIKRLERVKEGLHGTPLTRFMLDCKSTQPHTLIIWKKILEAVNQVFGDELLEVITCYGERVHEEVKELTPMRIRDIDALENPLTRTRFPKQQILNMSTTNRQSLTDAPGQDSASFKVEMLMVHTRCAGKEKHIPVTKTYPLTLHIYINNDVNDGNLYMRVDELLDMMLRAFGKRNVQSLYIAAPEYSQNEIELFDTLGSTEYRYLDTLVELTVDHEVSWHTVIPFLSKLKKIEKLDLELLRLSNIDPGGDTINRMGKTWLGQIRESVVDKDGDMMEWSGGGEPIDVDGNILPCSLHYGVDDGNLAMFETKGCVPALRLERSKDHELVDEDGFVEERVVAHWEEVFWTRD